MKIGDRVWVFGYVDEIRKDVIIIRNDSGYFGTEKHNVFVAETVKEMEAKSKLIRCKDCKHYEQWTNRKICMPLGSYYGNTQPNDYCSYAERKEE